MLVPGFIQVVFMRSKPKRFFSFCLILTIFFLGIPCLNLRTSHFASTKKKNNTQRKREKKNRNQTELKSGGHWKKKEGKVMHVQLKLSSSSSSGVDEVGRGEGEISFFLADV